MQTSQTEHNRVAIQRLGFFQWLLEARKIYLAHLVSHVLPGNCPREAARLTKRWVKHMPKAFREAIEYAWDMPSPEPELTPSTPEDRS